MDATHDFITILCTHCGHIHQIPVYCGNRFCPVCGRHRNNLIEHKLKEFLKGSDLRKHDTYKFLTLTIKNQPDLNQMTNDLISSFRRLRQRRYWRKHVRGGACVIEVTHKDNDWHVHLHIVLESSFMLRATLQEEWEAVSSGQGVYIRKIHSNQIVHYLTKYLTKDDATIEDQVKMSGILKGRRMFQPFGSWHDPITKIPKKQFKCPECEHCSWYFGNIDQFVDSCIPDYKRRYKLRITPHPKHPPDLNQQTCFIP